MPNSTPFVPISILLFSSLGSAQVASSLINEGDPLVGAPAGHIVTSLTSSNANNNGGFVVGLSSFDGVTTLSHAWGSSDGSPGSVLQTEGTFGPLVQTSFESFLGIANDGSVCYSASGTGGPVGAFDSVWVGNTPIAVDGDPHPTLPGEFWVFGSRPAITADGQPYFVGGLSSTPGGSTEKRGLFFGATSAPVLLGGDSVPMLPEPLGTGSSISFDYRMSTLGTHYISEVTMAGGTVDSTSDGAMVVSGAGLMIGGTLVQESVLVPVSAGGDGVENWDNFDSVGINEAGDYFFAGDTDGSTATDEIIVHNGVIRFREGDVVDGATLTGSIEGAFMNESGEIAYIWDIVSGGGPLEALYFEDTLLLAEGDEVDWDGDGMVDAGFVVDSFTGIAAVSLGSNSTVYFTADIDTNGGGILEGFFAMVGANPITAYCLGDGTGANCPCGNLGGHGEGCQNSSGMGALLNGSGNPDTANDTLVLSVSGGPAGVPGLFFQGANSLGNGNLFGDGLLCAGGGIQRLEVAFTNGVGDATSTGMISTLGFVNPGTQYFYQYWYRDTPGPCGSGFNTSNALAIQW